MAQYALLSVSDKRGIEKVAQTLIDHGIKLLSTGGTLKVLEAAGLQVESVDSYTGFPEMMDGRVKTLHPKIHGGLLALRDKSDHQAAMEEHGIRAIDYVIVNLYPFKNTIMQADVSLEDAIENIDIGGPSMLRSSAKNYRSVTVVTDPNDYDSLIQQLEDKGQTSLAFRQYCAKKVYQLTAHYDALIADYLNDLKVEEDQDFKTNDWDHLTLTYTDGSSLRYGENSHQEAHFYKEVKPPAFSLAASKQLNGKALSYNNLRDADAAIKMVREFDEPTAVAVKHMNPCGVAIGETIEEAFDRCQAADPISIFGGIVVVNRPVTLELAEKFAAIFLEIIIAPSFDEAALARLTKKKNLRLLTLDFDQKDQSYETEYVSVNGGILAQDSDRSDELPSTYKSGLPSQWQVSSKRQPTDREVKAMNFAMKVVKHVKSNAIVVTNDFMTLGVGAGQMNRVGSAEIALKQAQDKDKKLRQVLVMGSDAFLPMADTAELAVDYGVTAIAQPGGSIRDADTVEVCDKHDIAMAITHIRHFRH